MSNANLSEAGLGTLTVRRGRQHHRPPTPMSEELDPAEIVLLELLAGRETTGSTSEGLHVIKHIRTLIYTAERERYEQDLYPNFRPNEESYQRLIWLNCEVIRKLRGNNSISIFRILQSLQQDSILLSTNHPDDLSRMKNMIFSIIGWLSHLYVPIQKALPGNPTFRIDPQGARYPGRTAVSTEKAQRPVDELLRGFGETLPRRGSRLGHGDERSTSEMALLKFQVSNLNAATLDSLAGIKLVWIDSISAHLYFDPTIPALYLFKAPSFCKLQSFDGSFLSM